LDRQPIVTSIAILVVGGCSVDLGKLRAQNRKDSGPSSDLALETNDVTGEDLDLGPTTIAPTDLAAPIDSLWSPNDDKARATMLGHWNRTFQPRKTLLV